MSRILKRRPAKVDLIEQAYFIAQYDLEAAFRFLQAAGATFAQLARFPGLGKSRTAKSSIFAGVREFPIRGVEKHLVFYRPLRNGIDAPP